MPIAQAEAREDSTCEVKKDPTYGAKGDSKYEVTNSICLLQPLSEADFDYNGILPPRNTVWPWAEEPEEFFCVAETDLNKESRMNRIWSQSMLIASGLKIHEEGGYAQPKEPEAKPALMTLCEIVGDYRPDLEETPLGELLDDTLLIEDKDAGILRDLLKKRTQKDCDSRQTIDHGTKQITDAPDTEAEQPLDTEDDKKNNGEKETGEEKDGETFEIPEPLRKMYFQNKWNILDASEAPDTTKFRPGAFPISALPLPKEEGKSVRVKFFPGDIEGWMSVKHISNRMDALAVQFLRPKLEQFLQDEDLPDELEVIDPENTPVFAGNTSDSSPARHIYKRRWPLDCSSDVQSNGAPTRTRLEIGHKLGSGGHSDVLRGILTLLEPLGLLTGGREVSLAVKVANDNAEDRAYLRKEGYAYNHLSTPWKRHLQRDWSGYVVCDGRYGFAQYQLRKGRKATVAPLNAIAPKFYGFYEPVGNPELSPILLIEDCGVSVEAFKSTRDNKMLTLESRQKLLRSLRCQVPAMYATLAAEGILQRSVKLGNITIQPGPLSLPLAERSYETPSLRLIDYGRMCGRNELFMIWEEPTLIRVLDLPQFDRCAKEDTMEAYHMVNGNMSIGSLQPTQGLLTQVVHPRIRCSWEKAGVRAGKDGQSAERDYVYMEL